MDELTKTEKRILLLLVRLNSKDKLFDVLEQWESDGMVDEIDVVRDCYKLLSLNVSDNIDVQYLYYAVNNYDSIINKDFSSPIERVMGYNYDVPAIEIETISVTYSINFQTLPSLLNEKIHDVKEHFWEYDPDREVYDYLESDIDSMDYHNADVDVDKYKTPKNVIN